MATCMVIDNPDQNRESTERVLAALRDTGPVPPEGALQMMGGTYEGGWRVVSVWESPEACERFATTRLPQALRDAGVETSRMRRGTFEIEVRSADLPVPA